MKKAYIGGGCFWCLEPVFALLKGVSNVTSGYAGGHDTAPTYQKVCNGQTGHAEIIRIEYDPAVIDYGQLLRIFWAFHDPTTLNRQGNDIGSQYRSIILYTDEDQKSIARHSIEEYATKYWNDPIVTEVVPFTRFFEAEEHHQNYFARNPGNRYCQIVAAPKIAKLKKEYSSLLKTA